MATAFTFKIHNHGCGTHLQDVSQTKSSISNTIIIQMDSNVQEIWDKAKGLSCVWNSRFEKKQITFSPFEVSMLEVVPKNFEEEDVRCWMDLKKGVFPQVSDMEGPIDMGESLSMMIFLQDPDGETDLGVRDCWAFAGEDFENLETNRIQLTSSTGCVLRPKLMGEWKKSRMMMNSQNTLIAHATISAFKFPDQTNIHLMCNAEICHGKCKQCHEGKKSEKSNENSFEGENSFTASHPLNFDVSNAEMKTIKANDQVQTMTTSSSYVSAVSQNTKEYSSYNVVREPPKPVKMYYNDKSRSKVSFIDHNYHDTHSTSEWVPIYPIIKCFPFYNDVHCQKLFVPYGSDDICSSKFANHPFCKTQKYEQSVPVVNCILNPYDPNCRHFHYPKESDDYISNLCLQTPNDYRCVTESFAREDTSLTSCAENPHQQHCSNDEKRQQEIDCQVESDNPNCHTQEEDSKTPDNQDQDECNENSGCKSLTTNNDVKPSLDCTDDNGCVMENLNKSDCNLENGNCINEPVLSSHENSLMNCSDNSEDIKCTTKKIDLDCNIDNNNPKCQSSGEKLEQDIEGIKCNPDAPDAECLGKIFEHFNCFRTPNTIICRNGKQMHSVKDEEEAAETNDESNGNDESENIRMLKENNKVMDVDTEGGGEDKNKADNDVIGDGEKVHTNHGEEDKNEVVDDNDIGEVAHTDGTDDIDNENDGDNLDTDNDDEIQNEKQSGKHSYGSQKSVQCSANDLKCQINEPLPELLPSLSKENECSSYSTDERCKQKEKADASSNEEISRKPTPKLVNMGNKRKHDYHGNKKPRYHAFHSWQYERARRPRYRGRRNALRMLEEDKKTSSGKLNSKHRTIENGVRIISTAKNNEIRERLLTDFYKENNPLFEKLPPNTIDSYDIIKQKIAPNYHDNTHTQLLIFILSFCFIFSFFILINIYLCKIQVERSIQTV